jgi:GH24 family phage-related lysozyme (muramidase)
MDYGKAEGIRKKGLAGLITDNLVEGKGIGSSFGSAISDRTKATFTGIQQTFDPLNIAKKLTGGSNLAPALLGRLTGRKQSTIEYFANKKGKSSSKGGLGGVLKNGYAPEGEGMTETLGMIYEELKLADEERKNLYKARKKEEKNDEEREIERNQAIIMALTTRRKKEESERKKTKAKKGEEEGLAVPPKGAPPKAPTGPKAAPKEPTGPKAAPKAPTGPKAAPKAPTGPAAAPKAPTGPTATPKAPAGPAATPKTAAPAKKPTPIIPSVGTGIVAGAILTGLSDAAIAKIKKKEGFVGQAYFDPKRGANRDLYSIGYGHQINDKEIKNGFILIGDKKIPVVGENGKNTIISQKDAEELLKQDYAKYEEYAKNLPNFDKLNLDAQVALVDMTYNMGVGWAKGWPIFLKQLEDMDLLGASKNIQGSLYIKQVGKRGIENAEAIKNGLKNVPKQEPKESIPSAMIESTTKENKDLKSNLSNVKNAQTTLNNTNINQTTNAPAPQKRASENDRPAILEKSRG